jgi:hypothetical protein
MECLLDELVSKKGKKWYPEFQFSPARRWRFDYAAPHMVAVEIEGAIWSGGRHTRGAGYQRDLDKYNAAAQMGWRVFRFSTQDVLRGKAAEMLRRVL